MAFLSVMIPVYNGEELVRDAIESVITQPCQDLEVIIMDDGSKDCTVSICNEYAERDKRIKVISHENYGLGKNRNEGFKYVTGNWIIYLDHDDKIVSNFYTEELKGLLKRCLEKKVDVIVPARVRTDYSMDKGVLDYLNESGIKQGGNDSSWKIKHEFATLIYSVQLLRDNDLKFFETRPEMESIFRHQAVYCARKVLFTDDIFFGLRRANPSSISNTWNLLNVDIVRMESYLKLAMWHQEKNAEDKDAYDTSLNKVGDILAEYLQLLVQSGQKNGYDTNKILKYRKFFSKKANRIIALYKCHLLKLYVVMRDWKRKLNGTSEYYEEYSTPIIEFEEQAKKFDFSKLIEIVEDEV